MVLVESNNLQLQPLVVEPDGTVLVSGASDALQPS